MTKDHPDYDYEEDPNAFSEQINNNPIDEIGPIEYFMAGNV
jgi:hypothetical protein